jgi:hypothetical protein
MLGGTQHSIVALWLGQRENPNYLLPVLGYGEGKDDRMDQQNGCHY